MADDQIDVSSEELEWLLALEHVDRAIQELAHEYRRRPERAQLRAMLKRRLRRLIPKLQG